MHILAFILFIVFAAIVSAFQGDFSGIKAIAPWAVGIGLFILILLYPAVLIIVLIAVVAFIVWCIST